MSEVKRYNLIGHQRPDGQMVAFEDFDLILAEKELEIKMLREQRRVASHSAICSETTREKWITEQDESITRALSELDKKIK